MQAAGPWPSLLRGTPQVLQILNAIQQETLAQIAFSDFNTRV